MSIEIMTQVWKGSKQKGNALLCLLALADFADDTGYCFPSIRTLAKRTRMSARSVVRTVADLRTAGELFVIHGGARGNRYAVVSGCKFPEMRARVARAKQKGGNGVKLSPIGDKVSPRVNQNKHKPATDPSVDPSKNHQERAAFISFWESDIRDIMSGTYLEMMLLRIEQHGLEQVKEAVRIAKQRGKVSRVPYIDGILRNGGGDSLAAKLDRHVGPLTQSVL